MRNHTQNPADISPIIEQHLIRIENRLNAAQMALEMMTVANHYNRKSTKDLLSDCERLQKAAVELHQAMYKNDIDVVFEQPSNTRQPIQQPAPKTSHQGLQGKSGIDSTFENVVQLAKERLENQQKLKAEFSELKTKDWIQLLLIKSEKAYKGLQVEIDGQQTTIKTFADYCLHALGLAVRTVTENLEFLQEFGPDLFTALNSINTHVRDMRKVRKLSADQKQALLQIAQTGDKAAALAFIDQALQAGE